MIANAGAGTSEQKTLERVLAVLSSGAEVEMVATADAAELDATLARAGGRVIVVAGGDGSLHAVVRSLYEHQRLDGARIALIPLGTGNDFARGQGIPLDPEHAARIVLDGDERPVDLLIDEDDEVVVNNVHIGASAQASRRGARWKDRLGRLGVGKVNLGKLGYPIGAALAAVRPPFIEVSVEVDSERVVSRTRVLMVSVGNSSHIGGGTEVTPDASPEDGKADVMISLAIGPLSRIAYTAQMKLGRHVERADVIAVRGRRVTVEGEEFYASADGEIKGPVRRRTWTLSPAAYTMVLPKPGDEVVPD